MKVGNNILNTRGSLLPNPEEKPKRAKKTTQSASKKTATENAPKKKKATKPSSPKAEKKKTANPSSPKGKKKKTPSPKQNVTKPNAPSPKHSKTNKNVPKYRFNSPSNNVLTAHNFEDLFILEGKGETREEFKQKMGKFTILFF
jgi:hypothetical protein